MPLFNDAIKKWMEDWSEQFAQDWDDEKLAALVGKTIEMKRPEIEDSAGNVRDAKEFTLGVVGWTRDRLQDEEGNNANRWSILTNEGNAVAIYTGTTLTVVEDSDG